jgi:hypothetical protein
MLLKEKVDVNRTSCGKGMGSHENQVQIDLVFGVDEKYLPALGVTLLSILDTTPPSHTIRVFVLHDIKVEILYERLAPLLNKYQFDLVPVRVNLEHLRGRVRQKKLSCRFVSSVSTPISR